MKRFALTLLPTLAAASAFAQQTRTENIPLKYVIPTEMVVQLRATEEQQAELHLLEGIFALTPDNTANSLKVTGKPEAIANLKKVILLFDVKPRQVLIKLRLVRVLMGADGPGKEEVLQQPVISTMNNRPAIMRLIQSNTDQFSVRVVPRINGDNSVSLSVASSLTLPGKNNRAKSLNAETVRRIEENKDVRLYGFSDSPNPQVQEALRQGKLADLPGATYTAYFIDATASEVKNSAGNAPQP